jgi:uncharacterized membrane protein
VAVAPELLREFERLTLEVAEDERRLAKKQARLNALRAQILGDQEATAPATELEKKEEPRVSVWTHIRGDVLGVLTDEKRMTKALAEVIKAVHDNGGEATTAQLATRLGITEGAVSVRLSRAVEKGLLQRKKQGVYVLAVEDEKETKG